VAVAVAAEVSFLRLAVSQTVVQAPIRRTLEAARADSGGALAAAAAADRTLSQIPRRETAARARLGA
jgi:hypothetical protein